MGWALYRLFVSVCMLELAGERKKQSTILVLVSLEAHKRTITRDFTHLSPLKCQAAKYGRPYVNRPNKNNNMHFNNFLKVTKPFTPSQNWRGNEHF